MTTYFKAKYDNEANGPFVEQNFVELTWAGGGRGQIIDVFDDGATGKLHVALIAGSIPTDGQTMTQGTTTGDADGNSSVMFYPPHFRDDVSVTKNGSDFNIRWTGPLADGNGVIPTHSLFFGGQTVDLTVNQTLTFSGGQTAELIRIVDQTGAEGEIEVRFISDINAGLPVDGDTFADEGTGDGTVFGEVHSRSYTPLELHRLLADLNDDAQFVGNDELSMIDPTTSAKDTDSIIRLIGGANVDDTVIDHMYGGSIAQTAGTEGDVKYSGLDFQVTTPLASTRPVLISFDPATGLDAIVTDYWSTAWNPDSIAGNIRIMRKVRAYGVDIDGRRVKGKLLEFGEGYFEGGTTLGDATTSLAVFSASDGNNDTAVGTVAGAPYNTIVLTDGFQTLDYSNSNGATPFALSLGYGTAEGLQAYERTKYIQRRGTAETLFGRNAQLVTGVNRNFAHDAETGGALTENEIIAWGTEVTYSGQTANIALGETVDFSPSGARGRVYYLDDNGATGTIIVGDVEGGTITIADSMSSGGGGDGDVDTVVINSSFGIGLVIAYDDQGTTGNVYYQSLAGIDPVDDQTVFGRTSNNTVDVNGSIATRTINSQFIGLYTGTNFQTNFGIGINASNAILGDQNRNLLDVPQGVPDNQTGEVTGVAIGDRVTCYPWDGIELDVNGDAVPTFDQMTLSTDLTGAAETAVVVNAIPDNTPPTGQLRTTTNGGIRRLVSYTGFAGSTFTIPSTDFSGDDASISNGVMIAYLDKDAEATTESYTAIKGAGNTQVTVTVRKGDGAPIVPFKSNPIFGATGFSVAAQRADDS
ncbi:MAG: hypothetical protein GY817_06425 [bacterium]|nr:hypothetical protein [bacterium]